MDLLIDRNDKTINLCEIKWYSEEFAIDKKTDESLRHKVSQFIKETKTRKAVQVTLITPFGVERNAYYDSVQSVVTVERLFDR